MFIARSAALLLATWLLSTQAPATILSAGALIGAWRGDATHNRESEPVVITFEKTDDGRARAVVTIPSIRARMGLGRVTIAGDRITAGPLVLTYVAAADTLTGAIPEDLVPKYRMEVTFRRSAPSAVPEWRRPEAPTREPVWTTDLGSPLWGDAAVRDGRVVVGGDDGRLFCLDAATGRARWTFAAGSAIRARPAFFRDLVIVQSDAGVLHAVDAERGVERWRLQIAEQPAKRLALGDPASRYENRASGAAVAGDRLYVGTHEGRLIAVDAVRGERLWQFTAGDSIVATPVVGERRVFVGSFDRHLYAVDSQSGQTAWKHDTGGAVTSAAALHGERLIAGSRSYDLTAFDVRGGAPAWTKYFWFSWVESPPTVAGDVVYVGSSDAARVFALDARSGRAIWQTDAGGSAWGQPAVSATTVYQGVAGVLGYIAPHRGSLLAIDRASGRVRWWFEAAPPRQSAPALAAYGFAASAALGDGLVFAPALDGRIYAFAQ